MRILFLNPCSELGGAERCLLDLMASLRENNAGLLMELAVNCPGPLVEEAEALGVCVHIVPMPEAIAALGDRDVGRSAVVARIRFAREVVMAGSRVFAYARRLRRLVRGTAPDVIHSNSIKTHILAPIVSLGVPVVWHIRDLIGRRSFVASVLRLVSLRATAAIAISKLVERDARSVLRALPIHVVYDAIDTKAFSPAVGKGAWLDALGGFKSAMPDPIRVGLISTYARWKGQDVFIDAIAQMPESLGSRTVRYFIVGGPIYETRGSQFSVEELRERADRAGVSHRLGFVPFQRDIVDVFRSLDVVVHASTQPEPFGRTIAEAMSCGRAVVFSGASGAAELVPPSLAKAIESNNPCRLAEALGVLLADQGLRERLAQEGRELAERAYERRRLGDEVLRVLERAAE